MKLVRYVVLKFDEYPQNLDALSEQYNDVKFNATKVDKNQNSEKLVVLEAITKVQGISLNQDGYIEIPTKERKKCEQEIETVCAKYAVFNKVRLEIFSPSGLCFTFIPDNNDERRLLTGCKGFLKSGSKITISFSPPSFHSEWIDQFDDRLDGVFLVNEALSQASAAGSFRDYIRVFECGFSLSSKQLDKKLYKFLRPEMGYTRAEIKKWIRLRDPLSHADKLKSNDIYFQAHIRPYIERVSQAAFDLLYNKKNWNNGCSERREIWMPTVYTTDEFGHPVITDGSKVLFSWTDCFNVYTKHLSFKLSPSVDICIPNNESITTQPLV
jgi:hypothetical protein